jgi:hypothetical protein
VLRRKVLADDGDDVHVGEVPGGEREVRRRPAERVAGGAARRVDRVERHRSDDDDAHEISYIRSGAETPSSAIPFLIVCCTPRARRRRARDRSRSSVTMRCSW